MNLSLKDSQERNIWFFENIYRSAFWLFWCLVGLAGGYFLNFLGMLVFTVVVAVAYGTSKEIDLTKSEPGLLATGVALAILFCGWVLFWVMAAVWGKSFGLSLKVLLDAVVR